MNSSKVLSLISALLLFVGTVNCVYKIQLESVPASGVGHEDITSINVGNISLGTPEQILQVMLDTGSADFWVASQLCSNCEGLHLFDNSKSSTYTPGESSVDEDGNEVKNDFTLTYGTGSLYMMKAKDNVKIGGRLAQDVSFGEAANVSETFTKNKLDGIVGFGFPSLSRSGMKPVYQELFDQQAIDEPYFTFCQNRDSDSAKVHELYLGGTNPSYYKGETARADITKPEYWTFQLSEIQYSNGKKSCEGGCAAIADSGTTDIRGPRDLMTQINEAIGAHLKEADGTDFVIKCDTTGAPDVSFIIGNLAFKFTPDDYVFENDDGTCGTIFGISRSESTDFLILGQAFLKGHCVEFHFRDNYLVFAPIKTEVMQ